ncbi:MAG: hypothetical protein M1824_000943 [Vezdaea acicularis]|nr:MAG: hypothetical protein M1824_000943 [Vezdaea acicularis]
MAGNARFNRGMAEIRDTVLATQHRANRLATRDYVEEFKEETKRLFSSVQDSIELSAEGFEELTQACTAVGGRLNTLEERLGPQGQLLRAIDEKFDRFRQSLNTATDGFGALNRHVGTTMQEFQGRLVEHSRTVERQLNSLGGRFTVIENRLDEIGVEQTRLGNHLRAIEGSLDERLDRRLDERLEVLYQRLDGRLNVLELRFDQRFDGFDQRFNGFNQRLVGLDERFNGLDQLLNNFEQHLGEQHRQVFAELTLQSDNARRGSQNLEVLQREIRAGHYNNAARVLNTTVIKSDARLYEFRGINDRPILDFPTNPAALKRLSSQYI